jgi:hypothetical protein
MMRKGLPIVMCRFRVELEGREKMSTVSKECTELNQITFSMSKCGSSRLCLFGLNVLFGQLQVENT